MRRSGTVRQDAQERAPEERSPESAVTPDERAEAEWETEGGAPTAGPSAAAGSASEGAGAPIDYRDRWLRAEAEFQNFRRRTQRDAEEGRRRSEESVLLDLAAVLDDLERALQSAAEGGASPAWVEGVRLVLQKGRDYLARQGITTVDPLSEPFDPAYHEAVLEVDAPQPPGTVVQVVHKGYRRGERSLRAARVVVARGTAP